MDITVLFRSIGGGATHSASLLSPPDGGHMNNVTKISVMLTVVLIASFCLVSISEESNASEVTELNQNWFDNQSGDSYVLNGDYLLFESVSISKPITIEGMATVNLDGKTITTTNECIFSLSDTDSLSIQNNSSSNKYDNTTFAKLEGNSKLIIEGAVSGLSVVASGNSSVELNANVNISGSLEDNSKLVINDGKTITLVEDFVSSSSSTITNDGTLNIVRSSEYAKDATIDGSGMLLEYSLDGDNAILTKVKMREGASGETIELANRIDGHYVTEIGQCAFKDCKGLKEVKLPSFNNKITSVDNWAFSGCTDLVTVTFDRITTIGESVFNGCSSLEKVSLKKIESIGNNTFSGCISLKSIVLSENFDIKSGSFAGLPSDLIVTLGSNDYGIDENGSLVLKNPEDANFVVDGVYFIDFNMAIDAASDGGTITVLKDNLEIDPTVIIKTKLTLNLNGNTLKITGSTSEYGLSFSGVSFTIQDGTIIDTRDSTNRNGNCTTINLGASQNLIVDDVEVIIYDAINGSGKNNIAYRITDSSTLELRGNSKITANTDDDADYGSVGIIVLGPGYIENPTSLIIKDNVSINVTQYGISGNGLVKQDGSDTGEDFSGTYISVSDNASITATNGWGIYHPQAGDLSVSGNAQISGLTGIEMRSGNLNVDGGIISSTATAVSPPNADSGGSVTGAALVVSQHSSQQDIDVTISGGKFSGPYAFYETDIFDDEAEGVDLLISGGTFIGSEQPVYSEDVKTDGSTGTIDKFIIGGEFYLSKNGSETKVDSLDYVASGYKYSDGEIVIDETYSAVAVNGNGLRYDDLVEAVEDASDGETITILSSLTDVRGITIDDGKAITIDLNGQTITFAANSNGVYNAFNVKHGTLKLTGEGVVKESDSGRYYSPVILYGSSSSDHSGYTILSVGPNVTLEGWAGIMVKENNHSAYGVEVELYGSVSSLQDSSGAYGHAIYVNGMIQGMEGNVPVINIYEGASVSAGTGGNAVYGAGYAIWNISGGEFTGGDVLSIKSGEWNISGGVFSATGEFKDPAEANSNGSEPTGSAVSITSNEDYANSIKVKITRGTFTSLNSYALYEGIAYNSDEGDWAAESSFAAITIEGGSFTGNPEHGAVSVTKAEKKNVISGGSFSSDVSSYCSDGFTVLLNTDGVYAVVEQPSADITVEGDNGSVISTEDTYVLTSDGNHEATITIRFPAAILTIQGSFQEMSYEVQLSRILSEDLPAGMEYGFHFEASGIDIQKIRVEFDAFSEGYEIVSADAYRIEGDETVELQTGFNNGAIWFTADGISDYIVDVTYEVVNEDVPWNPPYVPDDDDYIPPIYVPEDSASSEDDDDVAVVACAAAAVVATLMAVFLFMEYRRK